MKFSVNKSAILPVAGRAASVASIKTMHGITAHILIDARDGELSIAANNLQTAMESVVPAVVEVPGVVAVDARKILDIVKSWPGELIQFAEVENRWIEVTDPSGGLNFHVVGADPEEFPDMSAAVEEMRAIPADALARNFAKAAIIVAPSDDHRAHVAGFRMASEGEFLVMDSTDTSRLSRAKIPIGEGPEIPECIVPKKPVPALREFLAAGGNVEIGVGNGHLFMRAGAETIAVSILEGTFPPFEDLIAKPTFGGFATWADDFIDAIRRVKIISSPKFPGIALDFGANGDGAFKISATNPDCGESMASFPANAKGLHDRRFLFNPDWLIDSLKSAGGDVSIQFAEPGRATIRNEEDPDGFIVVVMCMKE